MRYKKREAKSSHDSTIYVCGGVRLLLRNSTAELMRRPKLTFNFKYHGRLFREDGVSARCSVSTEERGMLDPSGFKECLGIILPKS